MALTLTIGRTAFKICHKEGSRTTVWEVESDASEETLIQTFKDVISFTEGEQGLAIPRMPEIPADRSMWSPPRVGPPESPGNGWAVATPVVAPEVPERLQGEVEMIPPEEQG